MALDALVDSSQLNSDLTGIANAIRTKGGTSAQLAFPAGFVSAVEAIPTGGGGLKYEIGTFTLATDVLDYYNPGISHNLGVAPKVVVVWTEDYSVASPPSADLNFGFMYLVDIVDCQQQFSSSGFGDYPLYSTWWMSTVPRVGVQNVTAPAYAPQQKPTASVFYLPRRANNQYWRAGVTYSYFISEAWWS